MLKRMNKRGQEITTIIVLGVAIIAAIFLVYWFYTSGKAIFDKKDILPGDLTVAAQACEFSASQGDKTSYCVEPKKMNVAGKDGYFNCPYIKNTLNADIPNAGSITCDKGYDNANTWAKYYCKQLKLAENTNYDKIWVNGFKCNDILKICTDFGGTWVPGEGTSKDQCPNGKKKIDPADKTGMGIGQICCLAA